MKDPLEDTPQCWKCGAGVMRQGQWCEPCMVEHLDIPEPPRTPEEAEERASEADYLEER